MVSHARQIHHIAIVVVGAAASETTQPNLAHERQNTNASMPDAKQQESRFIKLILGIVGPHMKHTRRDIKIGSNPMRGALRKDQLARQCSTRRVDYEDFDAQSSFNAPLRIARESSLCAILARVLTHSLRAMP
jgi:hypothetical protein